MHLTLILVRGPDTLVLRWCAVRLRESQELIIAEQLRENAPIQVRRHWLVFQLRVVPRSLPRLLLARGEAKSPTRLAVGTGLQVALLSFIIRQQQ